MKIYLVTTGDYSDYRVCGAFSTRQKAEKFDKKFINGAYIEEFEVDFVPERVYAGNMDLWYVQMAKNGNVRQAYKVTPDGEINESYHPNIEEIIPISSESFFCISVWARDKDHAIKIVNEKRTQYLANQMWKIE